MAMTLALGLSGTTAAASCASLDAPPTAIVPSTGEVLRAGHLGREIGDTEPLIHFYSDLIGLELIGARTAPRPFFVARGLQEFAELGEDDDVYKSTSRVALLPIPGTAAKPGDPEMTIEAIEIKGVKSRPYHPALRDPGASYLKIIVRDLDKTLGLLKSERYTVITQGDAPVELSGWPGITGKVRAVMLRDTDGYPVQLLQITPTPASTAPADSKVLGARVAIVVDNLETSCKFYQDLAGPELKFWVSPELMGDKADAQLTNTTGRFRIAQAMVPGSPVALELIEYQDHNRAFKRGFIQDPGTAHFLFMVKDTDAILARVHAIKAHTLSKHNDATFISPTVRSMFVPDPQGLWLEFMDHDVKKQPAAH
ncbi:MAG TPA: VOC family protein [Steroidobacteraceae bacterium]|jgi:catechol 2,3-dioxygenase-like lactoylglutathione lyase family enzyme|nr:VOC family protein [Steroidobacteraceae bacterium]